MCEIIALVLALFAHIVCNTHFLERHVAGSHEYACPTLWLA